LAWWDWEQDKLTAAVTDMQSMTVEAFLDTYGPR
jgi:hypothetical protein